MASTESTEHLERLGAETDPAVAQRLLNAATSDLVRLIQQPSREAINGYLQAARRALHRLSALDRDGRHAQSGFWVGQMSALVEAAQIASAQKVPDRAATALRQSELRRAILHTLCAFGRLRVTDLAERLNKHSQNLAVPTRELADLGLIDREESGRSVYLSATAMASVALEELAAAGDTHHPATSREMPDDIDTSASSHPGAEARAYILASCARLRREPAPAWLPEAQRAAREFEQRHGNSPSEPLAPEPRPNFQLQNLIKRLCDCESALLEDHELLLLGEDPIAYMPSVLTEIPQGLAVDVGRYLAYAHHSLDQKQAPGLASAQLLWMLAERQTATRLSDELVPAAC